MARAEASSWRAPWSWLEWSSGPGGLSQGKGQAEGSDRVFERQTEEKGPFSADFTYISVWPKWDPCLPGKGRGLAKRQSDILSSSAQGISLTLEYLTQEACAFCHDWNCSLYHLVKINPIMHPSALKYCNKIKWTDWKIQRRIKSKGRLTAILMGI